MNESELNHQMLFRFLLLHQSELYVLIETLDRWKQIFITVHIFKSHAQGLSIHFKTDLFGCFVENASHHIPNFQSFIKIASAIVTRVGNN